MTTTNDPLIGQNFDNRYRIEKRIGSGGMANVYLADDETLGRNVALKMLHQRYAQDSQFVERFLREASAAARLNHPNIVQVYDRGEADGQYYIAMEYIDGLTLKDLILKRGALTEPEVLAYARQGLHALRFAHRNGIVHRDGKPHNMMVDTDGRLKFADFGIARAGTDDGLTEAGSIVGTAQYLSPEQARGLEVSAPSDLYSLGVVMYEMATGRVPFEGDSPVNVALKHVNDPVPRPSLRNPDISPALESIILKAMEKDVANRYGSADEMLADLDAAREGGTTSAMTQVLPGMAAGAASTTVMPTAPAAGFDSAATGYQTPVPSYDEWDDEEPEDNRKKRIIIALLALLALALVAGALVYAMLGGGDETEEPVLTTISVPNVVGQTQAAATEQIENANLEVGEITRRFDNDAAAGVVLAQTPRANVEAEEGDAIDLVVSRGVQPITVPDVVGLTRAAAIAEIRDAGLPQPDITEVFDNESEPGTVISQSPEDGAKVKPETVIKLQVSQGAETFSVKDVVGESESDARAILQNFTVSTTQADSTEPQGTVIAQDPAPGTELEEGSNVTLTIASGINEVPDVVDMSESEAEQAIVAAGFESNITEEEDPTMAPGSDPVISEQSPPGTSRQELGTTIELTLSVPPGAP